MDTPICPLDQESTRHWMTVPGDWRRPEIDETYDLYWSDTSAYGFLYPRPEADIIPAFYDVPYYTHLDNVDAHPDNTDFLTRMRIHLAWRLDNKDELTADSIHGILAKKSSRVCDLGCGDAHLLAEVAELGHVCVGIEPDPNAREQAENRGLTVHDGTAESLPDAAEQGSFDLVILSHVLEHCLDPVQALRNARSLVKPGGFLVCETPNNAALGLQLRGCSWHWLDVPRHLNFFTGHSLRLTAENAGWQVESEHFTGYTRQFSPPWIEAEQRIWDALAKPNSSASRPPRATSAGAWWHFLRSISLPAGRSYDSVRVVCKSV